MDEFCQDKDETQVSLTLIVATTMLVTWFLKIMFWNRCMIK